MTLMLPTPRRGTPPSGLPVMILVDRDFGDPRDEPFVWGLEIGAFAYFFTADGMGDWEHCRMYEGRSPDGVTLVAPVLAPTYMQPVHRLDELGERWYFSRGFINLSTTRSTEPPPFETDFLTPRILYVSYHDGPNEPHFVLIMEKPQGALQTTKAVDIPVDPTGFGHSTAQRLQAMLADLDAAISAGGLELGETDSTAFRGDHGLDAYNHSLITTGNPHGTTAADVGAIPSSAAGAASGVATLNGSTKVPIAQIPTGSTSSTVTIGNDGRLSDARTPTAHKASHAVGGSDVLSPADIGAVPSADVATVIKATTETLATSTTLQDDDELFFAIGASQSWQFEIMAFVYGSASGDIAVSVTVPSGATLTAFVEGLSTSASGPAAWQYLGSITASGGGPVSAGAFSSVSPLRITGTVINSTNAGSVKFQWAQASSYATATEVRAGSRLNARRA